MSTLLSVVSLSSSLIALIAPRADSSSKLLSAMRPAFRVLSTPVPEFSWASSYLRAIVSNANEKECVRRTHLSINTAQPYWLLTQKKAEAFGFSTAMTSGVSVHYSVRDEGCAAHVDGSHSLCHYAGSWRRWQ